MSQLPDLTEYDNAALRDILANPDRYIPDAVHAAAKELASRHAVPRYFTLARTRVGEEPVRVTRRLRMDPGLKLQILFSESRLRVYCTALALTYTVLLVVSAKGVLDIVHKSSSLSLIPMHYYVSTVLGLLVQLLLSLFFWALASNLVSRKVDSERS